MRCVRVAHDVCGMRHAAWGRWCEICGGMKKKEIHRMGSEMNATSRGRRDECYLAWGARRMLPRMASEMNATSHGERDGPSVSDQ